jgi:O-antigen ligase
VVSNLQKEVVRRGRLLPFWQRVFRFSLSSSPFLYNISLTGLFAVLIFLIAKFRRTALDPITRNGLVGVSVLLILSSVFANSKGEAFLQLANFLPYFLFFAFLPYLLKGAEKLEQLAIALILTAIPINFLSLGEYILKNINFPQSMWEVPIFAEIRAAPYKGRALVMFDHPNVLASYLVVILGLGLGVILKNSIQNRSGQNHPPQNLLGHAKQTRIWKQIPLWLVHSGTYLNLVGVFCSGSRNGFLVAISQLIIFSLFIKTSRQVMLTGIVSLAVIVAGAAFFGLGGRALSLGSWADDPRVAVWQIALDLIHQRPWLGWGLGNFKLLYPLRPISEWYPYIYHPHNFWLLLGSETGILTTIALTLLIGYVCFRTAYQIVLKQINPSYQAILLGYFFAFWGCVAFALFDVTFYEGRMNALNWVVLAGIYAAGDTQRMDSQADQDIGDLENSVD